MDIYLYPVIALLTSISAIVFLLRITTVQRIIRHRAMIDVMFTVGLFIVFAGTLGGAIVAAMGGLFLSIMLGLLRASHAISKHARKMTVSL